MNRVRGNDELMGEEQWWRRAWYLVGRVRLVRRPDGELPGVVVPGAVPAPARVVGRPERLLRLLLLLDRPRRPRLLPLPRPRRKHAPHGAQAINQSIDQTGRRLA
jgi:hypothetical protein